MDESTCSFDVTLERAILRACKQRGITLVSIAHRPTVLPFHDQVCYSGRGEGRTDGGYTSGTDYVQGKRDHS